MVDCTTGCFEGVIALMAPGKSWSGRWNKGGVAECYAVGSARRVEWRV